ncbi:MAG: hypothetical protein ABFS24_01765 [Pseudomonadota bacterium]
MMQPLLPILSGCRLRSLCKSALICCALWSSTVDAIIFNLNNRAVPRLYIRVGDGGGNISEVAFSVPAGRVGDGSAITGTPTIRIHARLRASAANPLTAFLTVDSFTNPLAIDDPGSTGTIPFSQISWTARDGDIPSGTFTGSIDQPIVDFPGSPHNLDDILTFRYANTLALEAGTYKGRATYTFAVP